MKIVLLRLLILGTFTGLAAAAEEPMIGKALVEVKEGLDRGDLINSYPDEIPWRFSKTKWKQQFLPPDALAFGQGNCVSRVRAILTSPDDAYRSIAVAAGGFYQVLLSDDESPENLAPLWTDGATDYNIKPGFDAPLLRGDGPWRYFRKNQPRLVEIRYMRTSGQNFMKLEWSGSDGRRVPIPAECLRSPIVAESESPDGDGTNPDGVWKMVLDGASGESIPLDLKQAKALTTGWSEFHGGSESVMKSARDKDREHFANGGLSTVFGGEIEIPFITNQAGYGILATRFQLCNGFANFSHMELERVIDGVSLGREILRTPDGETRLFRCVTPWLKKGKHTLRLRMWQCSQVSSARLCEARVVMLDDGPASQRIRDKLASLNGFMPERGNGGFLRSPACVELISRTSEGPTVHANGKTFPTRQATMHSWWADVPLPESGEAVPLQGKFASDRTVAEAKAMWLETRVGEHQELWVRSGDSLRLTAWPDGGNKGRAVVKIEGKERETPDGKPWIFQFDKAGEMVVEGSYDSNDGTPVTRRMVVKVVPRTTDVRESGLMRHDGVTDMKHCGTTWPDGGDFCGFRPKAPDERFPQGAWEARPYMGGSRIPCALRAGPHGPVCGVFLGFATEIRWRIATHLGADKARDRQPHHFVATHFPEGWRVGFRIVPPGPHQVWGFVRPDPKKPLEQIVEPWHYGTTAQAEFWLQKPPASQATGVPGGYFVLPPLNETQSDGSNR